MENKTENNSTSRRITVSDLRDMTITEMKELKVKDFVK